MVLYNQYIKALQESNQISENTYLTFLESSVKRVSEQFQNDPHDPVICEYNEELLNIIDSNFALDPQKTNEFAQKLNEFAQKLGEADFYVFCKGTRLYFIDKLIFVSAVSAENVISD